MSDRSLRPRKECKRYNVAGQAHFLTFSCFKGLPLFSKPRTCQWMLDAIKSGQQRDLFKLWAYVIMPDHVHLVLRPSLHKERNRLTREGDSSVVNVSLILKALKSSVANRAILWFRENNRPFLAKMGVADRAGRIRYHFWQRGGGYDRNLLSPEEIHEKIEYVHRNPIRRELVARASDWPWSSARAWESNIDDPIEVDRESVPPLYYS